MQVLKDISQKQERISNLLENMYSFTMGNFPKLFWPICFKLVFFLPGMYITYIIISVHTYIHTYIHVHICVGLFPTIIVCIDKFFSIMVNIANVVYLHTLFKPVVGHGLRNICVA